MGNGKVDMSLIRYWGIIVTLATLVFWAGALYMRIVNLEEEVQFLNRKVDKLIEIVYSKFPQYGKEEVVASRP